MHLINAKLLQLLTLITYNLKIFTDNKYGHTQKPVDDCGHNFHADHHIYHMKNFGIYNCLMDMYFGTRYVIFIICTHIKGTTVEIETKTKTNFCHKMK